VRRFISLLIPSLLCLSQAIAQSPNGTINGIVLDPSGAPIAGAEVVVISDAAGVQYRSKTNRDGIYFVSNLPPGPYRIQVSNSGFKTIIKPDIIIHVQDALAINFTLPIGSASVIVTVEGGGPMIDTQDATVSTVVDRQFAENLPLNGRSFQTLIQLTPGVVLTASTGADPGQFSVNGQRTNSNYWMVDGVSANVGSSALFGGSGFAGAVGTYSVSGGTNGVVSVDAMQEFRIQTSTFAPEFGRTPGAQISIITRSGTNDIHGTMFDYFRNDALDANNWFNTSVTPELPKSEERQNDFGGTAAGPIVKDKTFFFFSYEGLRLRLPETALTTVPDAAARQNAVPAMQPFLNAYPFDPNQTDLGNGVAQFNASFSNPSTLDAYSFRIDHRLAEKVTLFGRYNYSPSEIVQRGLFGDALSVAFHSNVDIQTATIGATWLISPAVTSDFRFNYSRTNPQTETSVDSFRGAMALTSLPFTSPYTDQNARLVLGIFAFSSNPFLQVGTEIKNLQRQFNLVQNISVQKGPHSLKFGADYRRLSPLYSPYLYQQLAYFLNVPSAEAGTLFGSQTQSNANTALLFRNFSAFAQDTWRVLSRLTVTYGLRLDVDFVPESILGPAFPAVSGFDLNNLSTLSLAPTGTSPYSTKWGNVAPRFGIAYQISRSQEWATVARGGFGVFYDLASSEVGNLINSAGFPFTASSAFNRGGTFPLDPSAASPPPIVPPNATNHGTLAAFDPNLRSPYSLEWNFAIEQGLGGEQTFSATYVGAVGRRLIQTADVFSPNPNYGEAILVSNNATSGYNALQLQFQRRLSHGLQALASYTWSHSIDDASAGSLGNGNGGANDLVPLANPSLNRGPSDFDIRNQFSAGLTYDIPVPRANAFARVVLHGWSTDNFFLTRSALPVNIYNSLWSLSLSNASTAVRPDVVPGNSFYAYGPKYPGGRAINAAAFAEPPTDSTGHPFRQGDLGRNALRGFCATQWDFAVHREFPLYESFRLQFRAEMFNVLNHPNFGPPVADLRQTQFGQSTELLAQYLGGGNLGGGGFNPLYQIGGPRSIQLALKLVF
jgi:hypothetical protein